MKIENVHTDKDIIPHVDGVSINDLSDEELRNVQLRLANKLRTATISRRNMESIAWGLTVYLGGVDAQTKMLTLEL